MVIFSSVIDLISIVFLSCCMNIWLLFQYLFASKDLFLMAEVHEGTLDLGVNLACQQSYQNHSLIKPHVLYLHVNVIVRYACTLTLNLTFKKINSPARSNIHKNKPKNLYCYCFATQLLFLVSSGQTYQKKKS